MPVRVISSGLQGTLPARAAAQRAQALVLSSIDHDLHNLQGIAPRSPGIVHAWQAQVRDNQAWWQAKQFQWGSLPAHTAGLARPRSERSVGQRRLVGETVWLVARPKHQLGHASHATRPNTWCWDHAERCMALRTGCNQGHACTTSSAVHSQMADRDICRLWGLHTLKAFMLAMPTVCHGGCYKVTGQAELTPGNC